MTDPPQYATPHKHEVVRNLVQLNYENRLLVNRVDIELASYKQKRDTLLAWMQHVYGDLQPRVSSAMHPSRCTVSALKAQI